MPRQISSSKNARGRDLQVKLDVSWTPSAQGSLNMKINKSLISNFRNSVNSNSNFVFETYRNKNGKNFWNLICSCMDWISVSVSFISRNRKYSKNIDVRVMQLYSIISAIDIVFESICQLHRAIFNTNKLPFAEESRAFSGNKLLLDDNEYFKEIRAMFGAHPVNLKHKNQSKWFASWPHEPFSKNSSMFEIRLYSSNPQQDDLVFGVNTSELEVFLNERYNYLSKLMAEIERQYKAFCREASAIKIPFTEDIYESLLILQKEVQKRLNNEYYKSVIDELVMLFSVSLVDDRFHKEEEIYKNELKALIDELRNNLQNMVFRELTFEKILNPDYPYDKLGYSISKLYTFDFDSTKEPLYQYHMNILDEFSKNNYDFIRTSNKNELFLKLKMMLYRNSKESYS